MKSFELILKLHDISPDDISGKSSSGRQGKSKFDWPDFNSI